MKYNFDEVIDRKDTDCVKYDFSTVSNKHLKSKEAVQLWVADMDFRCPNKLIEGFKKRLEHPIFGYTCCACDSYYQAVIDWFKRRHQWNIEKEEIVYTANVVEALNHIIRAFSEKGDEIIIQTPGYSPFNSLITKNNRKAIFNPLINDNNYYTIDFEDLEEKAKTAKMMIFCSPHNPTGRVWNKEELSKVIEIAKKYNLMFISDEIHCDITRKGIKFYPISTISDYNKIIVCTAPSKSFNLGGIHCSNTIITNQELREKYRSYNMLGPNPFAIIAVKETYNNCEDWLDEMNVYIDNNFKIIKKYLNTHLPEVLINISEGTYLAWVDLTALDYSNQQLEEMISNNNVYVQSGNNFIDNAEKHLRINLATPSKNLIKGLEKIVKTLK